MGVFGCLIKGGGLEMKESCGELLCAYYPACLRGGGGGVEAFQRCHGFSSWLAQRTSTYRYPDALGMHKFNVEMYVSSGGKTLLAFIHLEQRLRHWEHGLPGNEAQAECCVL